MRFMLFLQFCILFNLIKMRIKLILTSLILSFSFFTYPQTASDKLVRKGVSLHDKGKYNDAISYYQQAIKINPSSMTATYEMALSYLYLKDYNNALKYSTKIINANFSPLLIDAYCVKSTALAEMNKVDQSIKLLNEGISKCGDQYLLHYNLGLSYFKTKNLRNSILHLQKAISIDTTHPSTFLLYAYALNDAGYWLESFLSFQFFLLLEPNTDRSKDAFQEMYDILIKNGNTSNKNSQKLLVGETVDKAIIMKSLTKILPKDQYENSQYSFFQEATRQIFFILKEQQDDSKSGLLWDFFVPIDSEILQSGNFDTYCRYISVSYFPNSLNWWKTNSAKVDNFIAWFEEGQNTEESDGAEY